MENWKKNFYSSIFCMSLGIGTSLILIINSLINTPEMILDYALRSLIIMVVFFSIGIPQIIYAFKHKGDKYFFPKGIIQINPKTIDRLLQEGLIKGMGLQDYPYEFNFGDQTFSRIIVKNLDFYFKIDNQHLPVLIIARCRNFAITNNYISNLDLITCSQFVITHNIIQQFGYNIKCQDLLIDNNDIKR